MQINDETGKRARIGENKKDCQVIQEHRSNKKHYNQIISLPSDIKALGMVVSLAWTKTVDKECKWVQSVSSM